MANKLGRLEAKGTNVLGVSKPREQINAIRNNQTPGNILGNNLTNDLRLPYSPGLDQFPSRQPENFENVIELGNLLQREPKKDPYMQLYDAYQAQLQENAASQKAYLEKMYGETADILNKSYDKSANNAYVSYRQNQQKLPEQLSSLGITGGASESANLKLQSAYGTNLANNEFSRNNDIASARRDLAQGTNEIDSDLNSQLANAYADYGLKSLDYKQTQDKEKKAKEDQAKVDKWNSSVMANIAKRQREGKEVTTWNDADGKLHYQVVNNATKKQKTLDKHNNNVQSNIAKRQRQGYDVYTWTDGSGKLHYRLLGKKKLTSSKGSSRGSNRKSGSSSGGSGSNSLPSVPNTKPTAKQTKLFNIMQANITNYQLRGQTTETQLDSYTDQIEEYYKDGKITEKQAKSLLKTVR